MTLSRRAGPTLLLLAGLHAGAWCAAVASARPRDSQPAAVARAASAAERPATALRFAPIVYLHPDDAYRPDDPANFVRHAQLRWAHDELCFDHLVASPVDAARLGAGDYRHRPSRRRLWGCRHRGAPARSYDSVRPRSHEVGGEGFFLDLTDDRLRHGSGSDAPVLFHYVPRRFVAYWFFYPYNDGGPLDHEGDWENIVVRLDAAERPTAVAFLAHGQARVYAWEEIEREGERPVVYSALGSHASYPTAGRHWGLHRPDHTARGPRWPAAERLRNLLREPWWGYGGAWGEVGELAATTGPKGPSPGKLGVPAAWLADESG